jgi:hypothetical protein
VSGRGRCLCCGFQADCDFGRMARAGDTEWVGPLPWLVWRPQGMVWGGGRGQLAGHVRPCWTVACHRILFLTHAAGIKYGMIEAISHLIHRDYEAIVQVGGRVGGGRGHACT